MRSGTAGAGHLGGEGEGLGQLGVQQRDVDVTADQQPPDRLHRLGGGHHQQAGLGREPFSESVSECALTVYHY